MIKMISIIVYFTLVNSLLAQQETFDFTNYSPPENWDKYVKDDAYVSYTNSNKKKDSFCRITVYKSIISKGSINEDFENEWEDLVIKKYTLLDSVKEVAVQEFGDWDTKTGISTFTFNEKDNNRIILSSSRVFNKVTSILIIYNNPEYETIIANFLSGVSYKKDFTTDSIVENSKGKIQIAGKWARSVSLSYNIGGMNSGYTKSIYDFKSDSTYSFTQRIWGMTARYIYVVKENGIYKMENNQVTLTPQKSIMESWDHEGDALIKLAASNKRTLETTTYKFVVKYDEAMKDWDLVLQANKETLRDGKFSGVQPYPNGWNYSKRFTDYDLTATRIY